MVYYNWLFTEDMIRKDFTLDIIQGRIEQVLKASRKGILPDQNILESLSGDIERYSREQAESQRDLHETLQNLMNVSRDGIILIDSEGRITDANRLFCEMTGFGLDELRTLETFFSLSSDLTRNWEEEDVWKKVLKNGFSDLYEKEIVCKNGQILPVEFCLNATPVASGKPQYYWGIVRDLSERFRAGKTLLEQDERFDAVALFINDWEYWRGPDGKIKYVSPSCERITGFSAAEFEINPNLIEEMVHPDDLGNFRQHKVLTGEDQLGADIHFLNFRIICKDKSVKWIAHSCQNIRTSDGTYLGIRGSNRDISEKKQIEAHLEEKNRSLAFLNQMAIDMASLRLEEDLPAYIVKKLMEFTGGIFVSYSDYDPGKKALITNHIEIENQLLKSVLKLLKQDKLNIVSPVSDEVYSSIIDSTLSVRHSLSQLTYGGIPPAIARTIKTVLNADRFYALAFVVEGELYGSSVIGFRADQPNPPADFLVSAAHLTAVSLRRNKAKKQLRESEERLRTTLYSIGDAVISTCKEGKIHQMNPVAEHLTGWSEKEAAGKFLDEVFPIIHEETGERMDSPVNKILLERRVIGLANHTILINRHGRMIPIADSGAPILDANGEIDGAILVFRDQTRDREIHKALLKEKETAKQYFNFAGVFMVVLDKEACVSQINKKGCEILGYEAEDVIGKNWVNNYIPEKERHQILKTFRDIVQGKVELHEYVENAVLCSNGEEKIIAWHNALIRDEEGEIIGTISSGDDITIRRHVEAALRESEEKYRSLIENMPDAVIIIDPEGNILFYNPPAIRLYDAKGEFEPLGISIAHFLHPDSILSALSDLESVRNGEKKTAVYKIIKLNGDTAWVEALSTKILYHGIEEVLVILHDITEQKENEESLRLSEERFAKAFNSNPAAVILTRLSDGVIIDANESYQQMFGFSRDELIGQTGSGLQIFQNPEIRNEVVERLQITGSIRNYETKLRHKHGDLLQVLLSIEKIEINREHCLLSIIQDFTDRKKAEDKLLESNTRINAILNAMPDMMFIIDMNGTFIEYFSRNKENLALPPEAIIGNNISALFPEKEVQKHLDIYRKAIDNKTLETLEYSLFQKGEKMQFEARITPLDSNQVLCIVRNITEQKRLEAEILYHTGMQNLVTKLGNKFINISMSKVDEAIKEAMAEIGEFTNVDRVYLFDYDFVQGIMINTHEWCSSGTHPEIDNLQAIPMADIPDWVATHQAGNTLYVPSIQKLEPADNLRLILEPQGIQSLITIPMIFEGNCLGFVGFDAVKNERFWSEDEISVLKLFAELLTNLKIKARVEAKLLEVESINQFITSNITDAVCLVDTEGKYTYISPSHSVVTGRGSEILGENFLKYIHAEDYKKVLHIIVTGSDSGSAKNVEYRYLHPKKGYIWLESTGKRHYDTSGKLFGLITSRNITERMKDQAELIAAKEKAEESDRLKTAFLNNMSHEIRTPLNVIMGFTELLRDPLKSQDEYHYFSRIITQSSNHLLSIINDIMSIATIEAGQEKVRETHTDINKILERLYQEFSIRIESKEVVFYLTTRLPDSKSKVTTDETKVIQIMSNLISNAIKFTQKGKIEYGCKLDAGFLHFFVEDTGIGIPKAYHERIFERFRQVDDKTIRKYGGNGLGLSISKAYTELLGGKIWVESEPGKGSRFNFVIPYQPTEQLKIPNLFMPDPEKAHDEKRIRTLLIAEDEMSNYLLLEKLLANDGFKLIHVVNGKQAVETCKSDTSVDLVLMDLKMPVMDGLTATGLIKRERPALPVIALTAYALSGDREKALNAGCDEYISKPFTKQELLSVMHRLLCVK